jgi:hypothetical protein
VLVVARSFGDCRLQHGTARDRLLCQTLIGGIGNENEIIGRGRSFDVIRGRLTGLQHRIAA